MVERLLKRLKRYRRTATVAIRDVIAGTPGDCGWRSYEMLRCFSWRYSGARPFARSLTAITPK
jgi:hypothetical protein